MNIKSHVFYLKRIKTEIFSELLYEADSGAELCMSSFSDVTT